MSTHNSQISLCRARALSSQSKRQTTIKCQLLYSCRTKDSPCLTMAIVACVIYPHSTLRTHVINTAIRRVCDKWEVNFDHNKMIITSRTEQLNEIISVKCLQSIGGYVYYRGRMDRCDVMMMGRRRHTHNNDNTRTMKSENYNSSRTITIRRCFSYKFVSIQRMP